MSEKFLDATDESAKNLFSRDIPGEVVMLNLLCFNEIADYSENPELKPEKEISGREAYQRYLDHTLPYLESSGGSIQFLGEGGRYFIGPQDEKWDVVMLIRQKSVEDFLKFATNDDYLAGIGHRTAALVDSRLLPIIEFSANNITEFQS